MQTKRKIGIGMTVVIATLGIVMALLFQPALSQGQVENAVLDEHPTTPSAPPEPFSITVNGSSDPQTITMKRGEISQIDVLVTPLIPDIKGNVYLESYMPECARSGVQTECVTTGITALLSQNSVVSAENLVVTVTISPDTKPGTYTYQVVADTMLDLPDQNTPAKVGNIHSFSINVI